MSEDLVEGMAVMNSSAWGSLSLAYAFPFLLRQLSGILAFVIDDVEDFLPFLDLLFHFFLAAEEKVEAFLKRAVAFVDPFGELADFLDGKAGPRQALDNLERGEVDVRRSGGIRTRSFRGRGEGLPRR